MFFGKKIKRIIDVEKAEKTVCGGSGKASA